MNSWDPLTVLKTLQVLKKNGAGCHNTYWAQKNIKQRM